MYSCSVSVVFWCTEHIKKNSNRRGLNIRIEIKAIEMEKRRRDTETSGPTRLQNPMSSGFLDSVGSEENKRIRLLYSELLSAAKKNIDGQLRTREEKSWALANGDEYYCERQEYSKLSSPFVVHTKDCSFPVRGKDFEGEMTGFESAAQSVSNIKTLSKHQEKGEDLSDEPAEKKTKEDALEDDRTTNGPRERESYWERRKKNNASAKKSRDARKTRELQTQIKAAFLERENLRIHAQLLIVQQENACLKRVLCAKM